MTDICDNISRLSSDIRNILKEQGRTKLNQTATLDKNKITDIKASVGAWRRTPKGKAVIYTGHPAYPSLEPNSRDVREMIEHERPFICRAVTAFGKPQAACYTPSDDMYRFIKEDIEQTEELSESLKAESMRLWGTEKPQTNAEKAFGRELRRREHDLDDILDELAPPSAQNLQGSAVAS